MRRGANNGENQKHGSRVDGTRFFRGEEANETVDMAWPMAWAQGTGINAGRDEFFSRGYFASVKKFDGYFGRTGQRRGESTECVLLAVQRKFHLLNLNDVRAGLRVDSPGPKTRSWWHSRRNPPRAAAGFDSCTCARQEEDPIVVRKHLFVSGLLHEACTKLCPWPDLLLQPFRRARGIILKSFPQCRKQPTVSENCWFLRDRDLKEWRG